MSNKLEGEGSYEGTRRYNEGVKKHIDAGGVEPAAEEAKQAMDSPEKKELDRAAQEAKGGPAKKQDARDVERADGEGMAPNPPKKTN
jgi:hypothetical protein